MIRKIFIIAVFSCMLASCSLRETAVQWSKPMIADQVQAMHEEPDPELTGKAMPANLKMLEGLLKAGETDRDLLNYLAEGFCSYAFSYVKEEDPDRAANLYLRGRNYALRALPVSGLENMPPEKIKEEAALLTKDDLPALYWAGQCWGEWLSLSLNKPSAFADISKLEIILQRNLELDEGYHYAGPHLALGVFYGSRSRMLGGNPDKAKFHFKRCLELTGNKYLLAYYFYAKTYAVQQQNPELFEKLLNAVLNAPEGVLPQQRLPNEIAKKKSRLLMEMKDELF